MAQIIECPACSTRYKLNKAIPEEGRNVKCARCAHQWKITPEAALPDEDAVRETPNEQSVQDQPDAEYAQSAYEEAVHSTAYHDDEGIEAGIEDVHSYEAHGEYEELGESGVPDEGWMPAEAEQGPLTSSPDQPIPELHDESGEYQPEFEESGESEATSVTSDLPSWWLPQANNGSAELALENTAEPYEDNEASYEEDNDALYDNQAIAEQQEDLAASAPVEEKNWSSRFMGPSWKNPSAADPVIDDEDEDPETVIRQTFQSALEQSEEQEYEPAETSSETAEPTPQYGSILDADWNRTDDEDIQPAAGPELSHGADTFSEDPLDVNHDQMTASGNASEDEQDYDAYYSDEVEQQDDNTPAFFRRSIEDAEPEESDGSYAVDYDEAEIRYDTNDVEPVIYDTHDNADPAFNTQDRIDDFDVDPAPLHGTAGIQDYDEPYDGQFEDAAEHDISQSQLSDDLINLKNRSAPDGEGVVYPPEGQSGNGLAVAAAWAVFLFVMGGAVIGLLSLRQEITTALPGTIGLYQMLGYDVSTNKVDFAAVDYRWSDVDGRPMIEVKGEVINITDETVNVPLVLVNVQSSSGKPVKATASVPTDELGPRDKAPFTLELVSPPEDVTQIELEFAPTQ